MIHPDHIISSMVFFLAVLLWGTLMFGLYPGFKFDEFDGEVRQMTWFSAWWLIAGHSIHVNHVSPLVSPWITTNHHSSSLFTINHHYSPHSSPLIITIHQFRAMIHQNSLVIWPTAESTKAFEPSDPRGGQPREEWPTANTVTWGAGDVFQDRHGGDKFLFFFLNIYVLYIYGFWNHENLKQCFFCDKTWGDMRVSPQIFLGFSVGTWLVQQNGYTIPIPASPNPESHPTSRVFLEESRCFLSPRNGRVWCC